MFDVARVVSPVWLMVLLVGSIYALLSITLFGVGRHRFISLVVVSVVGAGVGQIASDVTGWRLPSVGDFHIMQATLVALLLLTLTRMAARGQPVRR